MTKSGVGKTVGRWITLPKILVNSSLANCAARAIILAAEKYNKSVPVNLGSGSEISIKELVHLVARLTGFKGTIIWDRTKPDGQPRRRLDVSLADKEFGFNAKMKFADGLKATVQWYRQSV